MRDLSDLSIGMAFDDHQHQRRAEVGREAVECALKAGTFERVADRSVFWQVRCVVELDSGKPALAPRAVAIEVGSG
jgi:hypothetical protein